MLVACWAQWRSFTKNLPLSGMEDVSAQQGNEDMLSTSLRHCQAHDLPMTLVVLRNRHRGRAKGKIFGVRPKGDRWRGGGEDFPCADWRRTNWHHWSISVCSVMEEK